MQHPVDFFFLDSISNENSREAPHATYHYGIEQTVYALDKALLLIIAQ